MREEAVETAGPEETRDLGRRLAGELQGGDVLLLIGPLGAGKSELVRGLAAALGAERWRGSPTFNLVHEYRTHPPLYHADLYRLNSIDVEELDLEEYARPDSVLVVEWADRAPAYLAGLATRRTITLRLDYAGSERRSISIRQAERAA